MTSAQGPFERPDFVAACARLAEVLSIRPLTTWPGTRRTPIRSPFKASWVSTLEMLATELRAIRASAATLELAIHERDVRRDGMLRADARPGHDGVVLSFYHHVAGPLRYPCDTYDDWQDNVRALALGLHALRTVDRYGISPRSEQYAGWKRLTAGTPVKPLAPEAAAAVLLRYHGGKRTSAQLLAHPELARAAYREATQRTHPDRAGGDRSHFEAVNDAWKSLAAHHGVEP